MTLGFESATQLAARIRDKDVSSKELTEYFIGRIEKHDAGVNAVVVREFDRALEAATAADAALARGESLGPLHGLPITVKEAYDWTGTPTTWGDPVFKDNVATSDSAVVTRLQGAGNCTTGFLLVLAVRKATLGREGFNVLKRTGNPLGAIGELEFPHARGIQHECAAGHLQQ